MKILSTILFIVLIGLMCLIQATLSLQCLEYLSPFDRSKTRMVNCEMITVNNDKRQTPTSDNMFILDFHCLVTDQVLCGKVENVFSTAGKFIAATLNLKSPITVNATLLDLCAQGGCNADGKVLGQATPSRMVPYQGPGDDKVRLYPQALHKQLNLQQRPEYGPNDITAEFNSNATYWFEGDPLPILSTQTDMLYVVLHELVHGLGFVQSWADYFNIQLLIPFISPNPTPTQGRTGQFFEFIFDKYMVLMENGQQVTNLTDELNQFPIDLTVSDQEFTTSFMASPQSAIARDMFGRATTRNSLGLLINQNVTPNTTLAPDDVIILETSLVPYQIGSSIGHMDFTTYLNTSDFLMMFTYPEASLGTMMSRAGSTNTTGPIGPKLRTFLGIIGYEINSNYVPPVTLTG